MTVANVTAVELPPPEVSTPRISRAAAASTAVISPTIGADVAPVPPDSTAKVPLILVDKSIFLRVKSLFKYER